MHSKREGEDCHTNFIFSFLIIYIIVPLYRRKFYDGHIILVSNCVYIKCNEIYFLNIDFDFLVNMHDLSTKIIIASRLNTSFTDCRWNSTIKVIFVMNYESFTTSSHQTLTTFQNAQFDLDWKTFFHDEWLSSTYFCNKRKEVENSSANYRQIKKI